MSEKRIVYILLCLSCITISFNIAAIAAVIPMISVDLQLTDFQVSKIIPYYLIPYGIGALIYAPLTRILSYRTVLISALFFYALACVICGSINTLNYFLLSRILMGVTAASAIPIGLMVIGELFEKKIRGRLVGVFFSCAFIASLAGIILSGISSWRWLFYLPAILSIILSIGLFVFNSEHLNRAHGGHINYFKIFNNIEIRNVFLFIFLISFLYHGVHKWYGIYLHQVYQLDQFKISSFFIIAAFGGLIGQLLGGVLSDKKGRLSSCIIGVLGLSFTTMLLISKYPLGLLSVILFSISMFWTIGHNGVSTVLTDFSEENRPMIASLNSSVRFIGGGLGFCISSLFVDRNFGLTFFVIGILMLLLSLFLKQIIPQSR